MKDKILFMIIHDEILYLRGSDMDHKMWYSSLGYDTSDFEEVIRGFIIDNIAVFYKGLNFEYDEKVIRAAHMYSSSIREYLKNPMLEVYCGVVIRSAGEKWEPIFKITDGDNENLNSSSSQFEQISALKNENVPTSSVNNGPILEFYNNYQNKEFIKKAVKVTILILLLNLLNIFVLQRIIQRNYYINRFDSFLHFFIILSLIVSIIGYARKSDNTRYFTIIASICMVLMFDFISVILGVFYFLFSVDQNYISGIVKFLKLSVSFIKDKFKSFLKKNKKS